MMEYQYLTPEIQVPQEWPIELNPALFIDILRKAIMIYLKGRRVIVNVGVVSALVTEDKKKTEYLFEKTEEM